jgi:hypothetical protein
MRRRQHISGLGSVHHRVRELLAHVAAGHDYRDSLTVGDLLDLLILMTTTCRTLSHLARCWLEVSDETARRAVYDQLPDPATLTDGLVNALHHAAEFSRRDRRRAWTVAIDENRNPYYGRPTTPDVVGGQRKQGTHYSYTYATAALIHKRRRYVVGLLAVTGPMKPHQVVAALLGQIRDRGLRVGGVVLDSGFDSGETLLLLQRQGCSYTVPLRRKGKGDHARNALFGRPSGTVERFAWRTKDRQRPVETWVLVWHRRGEDEKVRVLAFSGWSARASVSVRRRAWLARRRYRERFGIETRYRQKNQGRAWTTSKNATYRLLLEGLSYLVRQVGVTLTLRIAQQRGLTPKAWVEELMLVDLLEWIADAIKNEATESDEPPENP